MDGLSSQAVSKLMKEVRQLMTKPLEGIKVSLQDDSLANILADIEGPGLSVSLSVLSSFRFE
jgi:hypothetical protein